MLLGIQVTRTLIANRKLVLKYALLIGSATTKRRAADIVEDIALFNVEGAALRCPLDDSTEEKY